MIRYETLLLAKTQSTEDDISMIERELDKLISASQGAFSSFDKWGKYKLAYPVSKQSHGMYILARYQLPEKEASAFSKALNQFLMIKCNEIVMRHTTIRLAANAPTTYQRPEAIDISRTGSVDSFLKEGKFENMLNAGAQDNINDTDQNIEAA